jgi:hypothetical protein
MDGVEREYEYRPKWWVILFAMGWYTLGAVVSWYMVSRERSDVVRAVYWVVGGLCIGFVVRSGVRGVERLLLRRRVVLTPACLLLPKSVWSSEEAAIDYGTITGVFISSGIYAPWACRVAIDSAGGLPMSKMRRALFLYVTHSGGKQRMMAAEFPSHASFEEFCELLAARVRAAPGPGAVPNPERVTGGTGK